MSSKAALKESVLFSSPLSFDNGNRSITQSDLVTGIYGSAVAQSRSVCQIATRNIGTPADSGVCEPSRVGVERIGSAGRVVVAGGVALECMEAAGGVGD